ncbi:hypothetical protein IF650_07605 [Cellulosimicrobium terreum]|nr:hypothetical protein [Cellulosimicrobium terreum]
MPDLTLASISRAEDAGYLALVDIADVARRLAVDYRLVGGHMVSLLMARHQVADVPSRETADADLGAEFSVVGDQRLVDALTELGYTRPLSSNRFVRALDGGLEAVIDVLAPSYTGKHRPNQRHGVLVVDEIPGLGYALSAQPTVLDLAVVLTSGAGLSTTVRLPGPLPALFLKLLAYDSRHAPKDAEDIWRMLAVCHAAGVGPGDWKNTATHRDAATILTRLSAINSTALRQITTDRAVHARIRALVLAIGPQ